MKDDRCEWTEERLKKDINNWGYIREKIDFSYKENLKFLEINLNLLVCQCGEKMYAKEETCIHCSSKKKVARDELNIDDFVDIELFWEKVAEREGINEEETYDYYGDLTQYEVYGRVNPEIDTYLLPLEGRWKSYDYKIKK